MNRQQCLAVAAIALLVTCTAAAQSVYKSIDAQGRVTYSSSPPPEGTAEMVETVPIAPGPTQQQRKEAELRAKKLEAARTKAERQRQEQIAIHAKARSEADQKLREARLALEEARIKGGGD